MTNESIWNKLLKLKNMPYGSVQCIANTELETEVSQLITKVNTNNCLTSPTIHDEFTEAYLYFIKNTKLNLLHGIEDFTARVYSNGTTEAFDKFYLRNKNKRLCYLVGEYMYHIASASAFFSEHTAITDYDMLKNGDALVVSYPFADTGNEPNEIKTLLEICTQRNIPVLIDCCYFGVCANISFYFNYPCVTDLTFSLSKNFPVQHLRIGMRLTRTDDDDPLFVYNKNKYVNRLGAAVGLELVKKYNADYNYNTYSEVQK
ncbi:hypothetical protein EBU71_11955, partial [bacterium]|nr:hypothetical protein [Candidatus Elulimicrobium humile]